MHQCGGAETIGSVVGEVALADGEQARDGGLQLVVNPYAAHRVVDGREDHHRLVILHAVDLIGELTGEYVGNLLIHLEEVAVALHNLVEAEAVDRLGEVEEHGQSGVVHAEACVAALLCGTRSHVARYEVAEGGIAALQIVVAVFLGNLPALLRAGLKSLGILNLLGHPDTAVVAQRL